MDIARGRTPAPPTQHDRGSHRIDTLHLIGSRGAHVLCVASLACQDHALYGPTALTR
eukprot:m.161241 g.161241  ORF g.161241 m.161241 type:complete len:57 (+) comp23831_c0_seq3:573-743(+)